MKQIIEKITSFLEEEIKNLSNEECADVLRGVKIDVDTRLVLVEGEMENQSD